MLIVFFKCTQTFLVFLRTYLEQLFYSVEKLLASATNEKEFDDPILGISVILRTRIATFSTHLSNIVWSSNLVAMQPVDGDSATPVKWKKFYSSRATSRNVPMQVTEFLERM